MRPPPRFNPRAPCGARPAAIQYPGNRIRFQFTRPVRGATSAAPYDHLPLCVSIHAPHAGRDLLSPAVVNGHRSFNPRAPCGARRLQCTVPIIRVRFNPRAPCGARHFSAPRRTWLREFQSTRPMRGATCPPECFRLRRSVSIHAPHAGRDSRRFGNCTERRCFNPRAPCGARLTVTKDEPSFYVFQSTRPMRGATFCIKKTTR